MGQTRDVGDVSLNFADICKYLTGRNAHCLNKIARSRVDPLLGGGALAGSGSGGNYDFDI